MFNEVGSQLSSADGKHWLGSVIEICLDRACEVIFKSRGLVIQKLRDGECFCAMWNFDGSKSEEAKSRAMCIADTFARRIGVLTDLAVLARILYDYDKMMNVRGDRLVKHSDKLCV